MKTVAFSILVLAASTFLFSCKNTPNEQTETATDVVDSLATETASKIKYVTAVSGLTLREEPNLQSKKLDVMPLGTKVKIITTNEENTMSVGGIDGAMDEIEYNGQKGYAFNGFLSKFSPPGEGASSKYYAEKLSEEFPQVQFSETTGGTASKPTKTETLILPTEKWHVGFFTARQLFNIPRVFAFPNPKGANHETQQNSAKKKTDFISELQISRNDNALQKIEYRYKTEGFGYTVTITKESVGMKLEKVEVAD